MRTLTIPFEMLKSLTMRVILAKNNLEFAKVWNGLGLPTDEEKISPSQCAWEECDNGNLVITIFLLPSNILEDQVIEAITHEVSHAVFQIEKYYGIKDNEFRAYLTGYLNSVILKFAGVKYSPKRGKK